MCKEINRRGGSYLNERGGLARGARWFAKKGKHKQNKQRMLASKTVSSEKKHKEPWDCHGRVAHGETSQTRMNTRGSAASAKNEARKAVEKATY